MSKRTARRKAAKQKKARKSTKRPKKKPIIFKTILRALKLK